MNRIEFMPEKGSGKYAQSLSLPITNELREALDAIAHDQPTFLVIEYGKAFSAKSLTGRMRDWMRSAGLADGCTLHALRKTLGRLPAEGGATTRQLMGTLGHDDISHAELYSRAAEQERLARDAMNRLVRQRTRVSAAQKPTG